MNRASVNALPAWLESFVRGLTGAPSRSTGGKSLFFRTADLNGTAVFRPIAHHMLVLRCAVTAGTRAEVAGGLRALTSELRAAQQLARGRWDERSDNHHQCAAAALVGFGAGFFRLGELDAPAPRSLQPLALPDDRDRSLDAPADLLISFETNDETLFAGAGQALSSHVRAARWLKLLSADQGRSRRDGRNQLGFLDGARNPRLGRSPHALELVLSGALDDQPAFAGGTYLVHRKYRLDSAAWAREPLDAQERRVGTRRDSGAALEPLPPASHVFKSDPARPRIFRRGISYEQGGERGLLFFSAQRDPRQFLDLYDQLFQGAPDRLLSNRMVAPVNADLFFVPPLLDDGFIGEQWFQPEPFAHLFRAASLLEAGEVERAASLLPAARAAFPARAAVDLLDAHLALERGDLAAADASAYRATRHDGGGAAWLALAAAQLARGAAGESADSARRAIRAAPVGPTQAAGYAALGAALIEGGDPDGALDALGRSLSRVDTEPLTWFDVAVACERRSEREAAAQALGIAAEVAALRVEQRLVSPRAFRARFGLKYRRAGAAREQLAAKLAALTAPPAGEQPWL